MHILFYQKMLTLCALLGQSYDCRLYKFLLSASWFLGKRLDVVRSSQPQLFELRFHLIDNQTF